MRERPLIGVVYALAATLCVASWGCGCGNPTSTPRNGPNGDAGNQEAGAPEAGVDASVDSGSSDAGSTDAGSTDGGGSSDGGGTTDAAADGGGAIIIVSDGGIVIDEGDGGISWSCWVIECYGHGTDCGNCEDDDGDGLIDWRDPECLGPCDNDEGPSLGNGVGGEGSANCGADCYFDWGDGPGNDDCHWDRRCDPLEPHAHPNCSYNPTHPAAYCPAEQSTTCHDFCDPITPNGCDCFGCCEFPALATAGPGDTQAYAFLGSGDDCTFDTITNESNCKRCTPVEDCFNDCGTCELCLGKDEVPPECFGNPPDGGAGDGGSDGGDPPADRCDPGVQACGLPGDDPCNVGDYCITGCCIFILG